MKKEVYYLHDDGTPCSMRFELITWVYRWTIIGKRSGKPIEMTAYSEAFKDLLRYYYYFD